MEEHRARVWQGVSILRDLDELPPQQQDKLMEQARGKLREWYRPMHLTPPDPNDPEWITVLIWDFMPEEDFLRAAENWRRVAQKEKRPFPEQVERRELMRFVRDVLYGKPSAQPAATPGEAGGKPAAAPRPEDKVNLPSPEQEGKSK
jgi:hypothetical protein